MPNPALGIKKRVAIKKATTWGTAVACGAGDEILCLSGKANRDAPVVVDQSRGTGFSKDGTAGEISSNSPFVFNLRYEGLTSLLAAMIMGTAGAPAQQGVTAAYKHTLKWLADPYGLMICLAQLVTNYIEEIPTAKVNKVTISGEVGAEPLKIAVDLIGINREVASAINTLATFASVTVPSGADKNAVMFSHLVFRMNDASGAALGSGDIIYPGKFAVTIDRKLKGEPTGQYRTTGANPQDLTDEATPEGNPEIGLTLEFPTHTATTYMAALGADTRKKLDITATGAQIATPYNYQHLWQFPYLQLKNANPTDDRGRIKEPLEFIVHGASAAPTGMTGITDPLWWSIINTRTTDILG